MSADRLREAAESVRATLRPVPPGSGRMGFLVAPGQGRAFEIAAADLVAALASDPYEPDGLGDLREPFVSRPLASETTDAGLLLKLLAESDIATTTYNDLRRVLVAVCAAYDRTVAKP